MKHPHKIFAASQIQSHSIIMKKFVTYFKKTAHFYHQLQIYKRQLASYINSIDYTLPFSALDMDRRGTITQQNIQNFLIQHKHFHRPIDIDRYYQRYTHGKSSLLYDDIVQSLVPHSDYILMSGTVKNIAQNLLRKQNSLYLCNKVDNQIVKTIVALIINTEITYLKSSFIMLDDLTNSSLKTGPLLWRIIDRHHDNMLDYQRMRKIGEQNGEIISEIEWKNFINWHFRKHKKYLNRADFMTIFDSLISNKRNGSQCNYESFVQKQILKKQASTERTNLSKVLQTTADRVYTKSQTQFKRIRSSSSTHLQNAKSLVLQIANHPKLYENKALLYTKLGYKNPNNLIKKSFVEQ